MEETFFRGTRGLLKLLLCICCLSVASIFESSRSLSDFEQTRQLLLLEEQEEANGRKDATDTQQRPSTTLLLASKNSNSDNALDHSNYPQERLARLIRLGLQHQESVNEQVVERLADNLWTHLRPLFYDNTTGNDGATTTTTTTTTTTRQEEPSYGGFPNGPVILGMERCEEFRRQWSSNGTIGVASLFNAGSNALTKNLQLNLQLPGHEESFYRHGELNAHGVLSQVPWWKHNPNPSDPVNGRQAHVAEHASVLPIVIVRDYYFWRKNTCTSPYNMQWEDWSPSAGKPCPAMERNNVTGVVDTTEITFRLDDVRIRNPTQHLTYKSMVDVWNSFHQQYWNASFPRLMVRFEDTLLYLPEIIHAVQQCTGASWKPPPMLDPWGEEGGGGYAIIPEDETMLFYEPGQPRIVMHRNIAKEHGNIETLSQEQQEQQQRMNRKVSALAVALKKNADPSVRLDHMDSVEQDYTRHHLDPRLMRLFHYTTPT